MKSRTSPTILLRSRSTPKLPCRPLLDLRRDRGREVGFGEADVAVRKAEVGEDILAAECFLRH